MDHRTDAIRYYLMEGRREGKTAMSDMYSKYMMKYQQMQAQQMQYGLGAMAFGVGQAVAAPPSTPMPVGPKINDLLLLVEEDLP